MLLSVDIKPKARKHVKYHCPSHTSRLESRGRPLTTRNNENENEKKKKRDRTGSGTKTETRLLFCPLITYGHLRRATAGRINEVEKPVMAAMTFRQIEFFGGAMTAEIPEGFGDVRYVQAIRLIWMKSPLSP